MSTPRCLTIAGSDSGGGAGIQADLKTFAALGVYGMSAVTAVTAQNSVGVTAVHNVPPEVVGQQIDAVLADIGADAVKSGMIPTAAAIEAVADALGLHNVRNYVLDPVMIAESGHRLIESDAVEALKTRLIPLALVVTPNVPEAEALAGMPVRNVDELKAAGESIHTMGAKHVLMKGGHMPGEEATDYLFDGNTWMEFAGERLVTTSTHGTGCTYAAAITAHLAKGKHIQTAVADSKRYLTECMRRGFTFGKGAGQLNHAWPLGEK